MSDEIPDAPPSPESTLALEIPGSARSTPNFGIDPLQEEQADQVPTGWPYLIALDAARKYLDWARRHCSD